MLIAFFMTYHPKEWAVFEGLLTLLTLESYYLTPLLLFKTEESFLMSDGVIPEISN